MAKDKLQALAKDITSTLKAEGEGRIEEDVQAATQPILKSFSIPGGHKGTNWHAIRLDYVMAPQLQTLKSLTEKYGVEFTVLEKKYRVEHWKGERVRFRTEMEEKVKSLAAQGLAVNLVQWDAECLQAARVLLGAAMQELINGAPTKDVHAAIATAQKVGLEALGRATSDGEHTGAQEDAVKVLEDYAVAISELSPAKLVLESGISKDSESIPEVSEEIPETPAGISEIPKVDPTKTPVHPRPGVAKVEAPLWVER